MTDQAATFKNTDGQDCQLRIAKYIFTGTLPMYELDQWSPERCKWIVRRLSQGRTYWIEQHLSEYFPGVQLSDVPEVTVNLG